MEPEVLQVIRDTIKQTVNGKIDHLTQMMEEHNEKHEQDMRDIKPIIEAYNSVSVVGNGIKWVAGVGTAIGVLWMVAKALTLKI